MATLALGVADAAGQEDGGVVNGLDAVAASDGIGSTFGDPSAQPYPVAASQIAHTEATLSTGPTGYALASTAWPGPLVANAGSLAVLLGAPSEARQANYAGRAEAFSPAGPHESELPGMRARAEGGEVEATAGAQDFEGAPGATTGDVQTRSFSSFDAGTLLSTSSCTASDLGFAEGAVTIGSVHTEAEATTDGAVGTAGGRTVVSGVTVGGQDAEVDEEGVRFTDPVFAPVGEQVLANLGMDMFVASPRTEEAPSSASHRAGSLVVVWEPPDSGQRFVYNVCGSDAAVDLRIGLAFVPALQPPVVPPAPPAPPFEGTAEPLSPRPVVSPQPTSSQADAPEPMGLAPAGFVRNLAIWPYIVGALAVVVAGIGLARGREVVLAPRAGAVICPLEGAPT